MAIVATQQISPAGTAPAFTAAASGQTFLNTGREFLHIKNTSAAAVTVTVPAVGDCSDGYLHDAAVSVPATTGERYLGPFKSGRFGSEPAINYSATAGVTVAVVEVRAG